MFSMVITSRANPIIKDIVRIADKKYRKEYGLYIVEGIKSVDECIECGGEIDKIICTETFANKYPDAVFVSEEIFAYISCEKSPQGTLALVKIPENILRPPQDNCLLLDRIRDPGNLGTIIRTANAAGFAEIYTINCVDAYSPKVVRASMSGIFFVKIYSGSPEEIFSVLHDVPLICADMDGENIFDFTPPPKFCLCVGNEGSGVGDEILNRSEYKVKIPMRETCESLNAAVSAGIAMYQLKMRSKR